MTEQDAQYAFRKALIPLLPEVDCSVVWAVQDNRTNLAKPYYSLAVSPSHMVGGDEEGAVNQAGVMTITGSREVRITITRVADKGDHPLQVLTEVRDAMSKPSFRWAMRRAGISLGMTYDCLDVSRKISESEIEPRGALECLIRYQTKVTDNVGVIDTAEIALDIDGKTQTIVATRN